MTPHCQILLLYSVFTTVYMQLESSMGRSNVDTPPERQLLAQCPREWQWACRNGECIPRYDTCDGIPQCSDGSDEWDCQDGKIKQNAGALHPQKGATPPKVNQPIREESTTVTPLVDDSYVMISKKQAFLTFVLFVFLAALVVLVVRRKARRKALGRNRRGGGRNMQQDSDEDDILISSMYS